MRYFKVLNEYAKRYFKIVRRTSDSTGINYAYTLYQKKRRSNRRSDPWIVYYGANSIADIFDFIEFVYEHPVVNRILDPKIIQALESPCDANSIGADGAVCLDADLLDT